MRVDAINQISQIYKPASPRKIEKQGEDTKKDACEISQTAKDYQIAKNAIAETPDVREEKVAQMKEALASGTYNVSSQEIADKMISKFFDFTV